MYVCMYVHVYMYVCMYVCTCIYVCMYVHRMYVYVCVVGGFTIHWWYIHVVLLGLVYSAAIVRWQIPLHCAFRHSTDTKHCCMGHFTPFPTFCTEIKGRKLLCDHLLRVELWFVWIHEKLGVGLNCLWVVLQLTSSGAGLELNSAILIIRVAVTTSLNLLINFAGIVVTVLFHLITCMHIIAWRFNIKCWESLSCIASLVSCLCVCTGAVYLKNCVFKYWKPLDLGEVGGSAEANSGEELPPYSIPEQSKSLIRENIVGAVIHTPLLIGCVQCSSLHMWSLMARHCEHGRGRGWLQYVGLCRLVGSVFEPVA